MRIRSLTPAFALALSAAALGQEFWPIDSRSKAMGNAGVATVEGAGASYLNPANLAAGSTQMFEFLGAGFGFGATAFVDVGVEGDTIATLDRISDLYNELNFEATQNALNTGAATATDIQNAILILNEIRKLNEDGHGVFANAAAGFDFRMGNIGVFGRYVAFTGADPFADLSAGADSAFSSLDQATFFGQFVDAGGPASSGGILLSADLVAAGLFGDADLGGTDDNDELALQSELSLGGTALDDPATRQAIVLATQAMLAGAAAADTLFFNDSGIEFRAVIMQEVGVAIGVPIPILPMLSSFRVGIALKEVIAETFVERITLQEIEDGADIVDEIKKRLDENRERVNKFNIDAGLAISPIPWLTVGFSAKNLLPMEFEFEEPSLVDKLEVRPQYKLGAGLSLMGMLKVSADLDLKELDMDQIGGLDTQLLSGGVEFGIGVVSVRAGAFGNLAAEDTNPVYTFGVGVGFAGLTLDINGQLATEKIKIESESATTDELEIPSRLSLSASLGFDMRF